MQNSWLLLLFNILIAQRMQLVENAAIRRKVPDAAEMGNMQIGPPINAPNDRHLGPDGPPLVRKKDALKLAAEKEGIRRQPVKLNHDSNKQIDPPLHAVGPGDHMNVGGVPFQKPRDKLAMMGVQPPDHLKAVRMHQDGDLNRNYKREIFLGLEDHRHGEDAEGKEEEILPKIFKLADKDGDNYLSIEELTDWIVLKVDEHFKEATDVNLKIFRVIDTDGDGYVTWEEFRNEYLLAKGYYLLPKDVVEQQGVDAAYNLPEKDVMLLSKYDSRWKRADSPPEDGRLDVSEFKSFRHPEQNAETLNDMVEDIMLNIDKNGDRVITEQEFAALPPGEVAEFPNSDREWQEERREEYRKVVDMNQDGRVDEEELQRYLDPRNRNHARLEAENLVGMGDVDGDNKLSLDEVLGNRKLFLGSKMVNTGKNFHEEF